MRPQPEGPRTLFAGNSSGHGSLSGYGAMRGLDAIGTSVNEGALDMMVGGCVSVSQR